jgi:hypothetical protein
MAIPCDDVDLALFQASTYIRVGNGKKAMFWHNKWLQGSAPKDIAPNLFHLARFKKRTMHKELMNDNWMCAVRQLSTQVELREFIRLWQLLREVSQSADVEDQILWKWMTNGEYTVNSAYSVQFQGSHPLFPSNKLWKAKTESKVKIFAWTTMHQKILIAKQPHS